MTNEPQKSEWPAATGQNAANQTNQAPIVPAAEAAHNSDKLLASIRASLALKGHAVHVLADGSFLVARWGLTRPCADLAALRAFAEMVGVLL